MKPETDADMLFRRSGSVAAQKLHKEAKRLRRAEDRKAWWSKNKPEKRND